MKTGATKKRTRKDWPVPGTSGVTTAAADAAAIKITDATKADTNHEANTTSNHHTESQNRCASPEPAVPSLRTTKRRRADQPIVHPSATKVLRRPCDPRGHQLLIDACWQTLVTDEDPFAVDITPIRKGATIKEITLAAKHRQRTSSTSLRDMASVSAHEVQAEMPAVLAKIENAEPGKPLNDRQSIESALSADVTKFALQETFDIVEKPPSDLNQAADEPVALAVKARNPAADAAKINLQDAEENHDSDTEFLLRRETQRRLELNENNIATSVAEKTALEYSSAAEKRDNVRDSENAARLDDATPVPAANPEDETIAMKATTNTLQTSGNTKEPTLVNNVMSIISGFLGGRQQTRDDKGVSPGPVDAHEVRVALLPTTLNTTFDQDDSARTDVQASWKVGESGALEDNDTPSSMELNPDFIPEATEHESGSSREVITATVEDIIISAFQETGRGLDTLASDGSCPDRDGGSKKEAEGDSFRSPGLARPAHNESSPRGAVVYAPASALDQDSTNTIHILLEELKTRLVEIDENAAHLCADKGIDSIAGLPGSIDINNKFGTAASQSSERALPIQLNDDSGVPTPLQTDTGQLQHSSPRNTPYNSSKGIVGSEENIPKQSHTQTSPLPPRIQQSLPKDQIQDNTSTQDASSKTESKLATWYSSMMEYGEGPVAEHDGAPQKLAMEQLETLELDSDDEDFDPEEALDEYSSDGGGGSSDDDFSDARSDCWSDSEGDHSAREDVGTDEEDEDPLHCLLPPLHPDIFFHSTVPSSGDPSQVDDAEELLAALRADPTRAWRLRQGQLELRRQQRRREEVQGDTARCKIM